MSVSCHVTPFHSYGQEWGVRAWRRGGSVSYKGFVRAQTLTIRTMSKIAPFVYTPRGYVVELR